MTKLSFQFSHVGMAVPSIEQAIDLYQEIFGYTVLSGPFNDPVQSVSVCFLGTRGSGNPTIELIAPNGEKSPVNKILTKGIGAYHLCHEVDDIEEALEYVRSRGCIVISKPVSAIAFGGHRIAWFYTPSHHLMELVEWQR